MAIDTIKVPAEDAPECDRCGNQIQKRGHLLDTDVHDARLTGECCLEESDTVDA